MHGIIVLMKNKNLVFLKPWSLSDFDSQDNQYGILYFFPSNSFALYCQVTDVVFAITPGLTRELLGTEVGTTEFNQELGNSGLLYEEVA